MTETALITGAAGFIGRHAAQHFSEQGWVVVGIDRAPLQPRPAFLSSYYELQLPHEGLRRIVQTHVPQVVIHCAGPASVGESMADPPNDFYNSMVLTFEMLNTLRVHHPGCRFVLISSAAVYGNPRSLPVGEEQCPAPISPYGFHKMMCEQLCQEFAQLYGMASTAVRIFSAYGPGLKRQVLWDICRKALTEDAFILQGTGRESRDFVHVLDIVNALRIISVKAPMKGEVYNLGSGQEVTIAELAGRVLEILNSSKAPHFDGILPRGNPRKWRADISRLRALGFTPNVSLEEGVRTVLAWFGSEGGA